MQISIVIEVSEDLGATEAEILEATREALDDESVTLTLADQLGVEPGSLGFRVVNVQSVLGYIGRRPE